MKYSIIIPVGPGRKVEVLECLKNQRFNKKEYEIIIIEGTNVPENRNKGFAKSRGDWVIYLDDDAYIKEDYLLQVDAFIKQHPDIAVFGGPQLTPDSDGGFAKASGKVLGCSIVCPGIYKRYITCEETLKANSSYLTGANLIINREVLKEISFDEQQYPADDVLFVNKAMDRHFIVGYSPNVCIWHKRRPDALGLFKQIYGYGKSGAELSSGRDKSLIGRILFAVPALFVLYLLLFAVTIWIDWLFSIWIIPILFYFILGLSLSAKRLTFRFLPIMFIIHVAYGCGVLGVWFKQLFRRIKKQCLPA